MHFNQSNHSTFFQSMDSFMHYVDNADIKSLDIILIRLTSELYSIKNNGLTDMLELKIQYVKDVIHMRDPDGIQKSSIFNKQ